ncbi:uncharacterized protein RAG0_08324 [Rhynchosporium agropyri]|uniref:Uncharacterized protein n=1 Tax=Rhynchosporium agropyri TaxID=914238 RepID=A0A1E1KTF1_9HELO|nr:uncharacterized protein RAG0_08324 [Rhynchosporium agropyri]
MPDYRLYNITSNMLVITTPRQLACHKSELVSAITTVSAYFPRGANIGKIAGEVRRHYKALREALQSISPKS